jgi:hypothetical protein
MFIKWRKYQRQLNGVKGDKYIQQPLIVESYRPGLKGLEAAKKMRPADIPADFYDSPEVRKITQRPRHRVVYKLPSYPLCMVVYFRSPEFMKQRFLWWEAVDKLLAKLAEVRDDMPPEVVDRLKSDLDTVVPRVTPEQVKQLSVVLNDLPLH